MITNVCITVLQTRTKTTATQCSSILVEFESGAKNTFDIAKTDR